MSDLPPIEERVQALATVLDEKRPGWRDEIDVERITFTSINDCVLGQLYGNYMRGVEALGQAFPNGFAQWSYEHAVELPDAERQGSFGYFPLDEAWKTYLRSNA